jgi:hypothetical protein
MSGSFFRIGLFSKSRDVGLDAIVRADEAARHETFGAALPAFHNHGTEWRSNTRFGSGKSKPPMGIKPRTRFLGAR